MLKGIVLIKWRLCLGGSIGIGWGLKGSFDLVLKLGGEVRGEEGSEHGEVGLGWGVKFIKEIKRKINLVEKIIKKDELIRKES